MDITKKVRQLRVEKHLSQKDIADQIGMTQPNYNKLEAGKIKPKLETAEKLADAFDVTLDELRGIGIHIENNESNPNQKIANIMTHESDELILSYKNQIAILQTQVADKEEIICLKNEKIILLESLLAKKDSHASV